MVNTIQIITIRVLALCGLLIATGWSHWATATPAFARQYDISCTVCHDAFPRLNAFGEDFAASNFRLPNWRETMKDVGDEQLALPDSLPLAIRAQSYMQARDGEEVDPLTGPTGNDSSFGFQAPYLIKLLSSAPLSENISYYFYAIFAEKGGNGETVVEDAWVSYSDILDSGVSAQLGQFQVSDLMFPREVRLTFQDYYAYRAAGITYDRGIIFDRGFGAVNISVGAVNGNGIHDNFDLNSPGYQRPDNLFDNNTGKGMFARAGMTLGPVSAGLFALDGEQKAATGFAGEIQNNDDTDKQIVGIDLSGSVTPKVHWFAQGLWNQWDDGFLAAFPNNDYNWFASFVGVDYIANERWTFSALHNYAEADDFDNTATIYEGIDMHTLTFGAAYYFMRNVKGVAEVNVDLLDADDNGPPYVGHQTKENYFLIGIDLAY